MFLVMEERPRKVFSRQPYTMDNCPTERFYKKRYWKDKLVYKTCVCLALTFQVQLRSFIVGNSASAVGAQKIFKSTYRALINEYYSLSADTEKHQRVLEHSLLKLDF